MSAIVHLAYGKEQPWPYIACGISAWSPKSSRELADVTCVRVQEDESRHAT